ncbi:MAG: DUF4363 family protein [Ruminococcus sp.]|nr:DUF4363 family protein [Ruminococcus sp.]
MKRLYTAAVLFLIAIGLCIVEYVSINKYADEYVERIDRIEEMVKTGSTQKAAFAAREAEKNWEETVSIIDMLLFHDYVDEIGANLVQLEYYIKYGEEAELFATCESTKEQLLSLKESELPDAKNII